MMDEPPSIIFIVPYRDRVEHKYFFSEYMNKVVMADHVKNKDYAIYFVEQKDSRPFNRGAMKNIGFLAIKYKYPLHYRDITFVFNDVDTSPYKKNILNYTTQHGTIKHFYGFTFALGGIFSITGADFEKTGGFPNFWGWGCEDNCIYDRAIQNGIYVDRSNFFKIGDMNILQFYDGTMRNICRKEAYLTKFNSVTESLFTIKNLKFDYNNNATNSGDCGVDVHHFDIQTDASTAKIESQNIMTNTKIDIVPIVKEMFGLNLPTMKRSQSHSQSQSQTRSQTQTQLPVAPPQMPVAPSNFRNRNAHARIYMMKNAFTK
jgi:hypothetical protein